MWNRIAALIALPAMIAIERFRRVDRAPLGVVDRVHDVTGQVAAEPVLDAPGFGGDDRQDPFGLSPLVRLDQDSVPFGEVEHDRAVLGRAVSGL